jgi:hypothetical protein
MNHAINITTAMIIAFFAGIGVMYTSCQQVIEAQARKIAAITEASYAKQTECAQLLSDINRKRQK